MNIINRKSIVASALALGLTSALGAATVNAAEPRHATERYTEYADVIDVRPVYKNIRVREPRQQCWTETEQRIVGYEQPRHEHYQAHRSDRSDSSGSSGNAVIGGLIGGAIGNQLGRGHSSGTRAGATIAGAIIGSAVGNEARGEPLRHRRSQSTQHRQTTKRRGAPIYETVEVERCKQVSESRLEQRIQHYDVTYVYRGRTLTTRMNRDPGNQIELQVNVAPVRQ